MVMVGRTTVFLFWIAAAALTLQSQAAAGGSLPQPEGKVILTVSGNITNTNDGDQAEFDLDMLHALGTQAISVTTSWTDGTQEFSGVRMRDLMETVGAMGQAVKAISLNGSTYTIEIQDFLRYPVILATKLNGKILKVRDKGPLWIVYPLYEFTEREKLSIEPRMVWQLQQLIVK